MLSRRRHHDTFGAQEGDLPYMWTRVVMMNAQTGESHRAVGLDESDLVESDHRPTITVDIVSHVALYVQSWPR